MPRTTSTGSGGSAGRRWRSPSAALAAGALVLAVAVSAGTVAVLWPGATSKRLTAYFERAVGVYPASHVRVLGVTVGRVTAVQPAGDVVRVEIAYDASRRIPAQAKAVVIAPSLASDRYVQLAPAYQGGPVLQDGATLPVSRTAVPVEVDEIFASLDELTVALGPDGANEDGSLSRLLQVGADNLEGRGDDVRETTENLADAARTLSSGRDDLFETVENLQTFTTALADADRDIRAFNQDLAAVSAQLDGEREELAAALEHLSVALEQITEFVHDNRGELSEGVADLTTISEVLAQRHSELAEFLDTIPLAAGNAWQTFDPTSQTLATRINPQQVQSPARFLCSLLYSLGVPPSECEPLLTPLNLVAQDALPLGVDPSVVPLLVGEPDIREPPPEARGGAAGEQEPPSGGGAAGTPARTSTPGTAPPDPTLGGILAPPDRP